MVGLRHGTVGNRSQWLDLVGDLAVVQVGGGGGGLPTGGPRRGSGGRGHQGGQAVALLPLGEAGAVDQDDAVVFRVVAGLRGEAVFGDEDRDVGLVFVVGAADEVVEVQGAGRVVGVAGLDEDEAAVGEVGLDVGAGVDLDGEEAVAAAQVGDAEFELGLGGVVSALGQGRDREVDDDGQERDGGGGGQPCVAAVDAEGVEEIAQDHGRYDDQEDYGPAAESGLDRRGGLSGHTGSLRELPTRNGAAYGCGCLVNQANGDGTSGG